VTKNIVDIINVKIKELQKNLFLLKSASDSLNIDNLKEDMLRYWGIERGLQISIECIIDIANIIISSINIEKPDTYRETIIILGKEGVLPKAFAKEISNMVAFRNILVHDYMKIDEEIMIDILKKHLDDFGKFAGYINKWICKN
jgi:uncharacterized protein YutE (UPF0331/DUF86 family)